MYFHDKFAMLDNSSIYFLRGFFKPSNKSEINNRVKNHYERFRIGGFEITIIYD